jgi:hypothetical protein
MPGVDIAASQEIGIELVKTDLRLLFFGTVAIDADTFQNGNDITLIIDRTSGRSYENGPEGDNDSVANVSFHATSLPRITAMVQRRNGGANAGS